MAFIRRTLDDTPVREFGIQFTKDKFGYDFISHQIKNKIDLISPDDETFGAEMEGGGWEGNFWDNEKYYGISNIGEATINIPIRKVKYWYNKTDNGLSPNKNKHLFIRTNKDFTQAIVIKPKTIKDENKIIWTKFMPSNSREVESWMSFRRKDVETYNLKNGKWIKERKK